MDRNNSGHAQIFLGKLTNPIPSLFLVLPLLMFSLSAIDVWYTGFGWHDQQRISQLLLIGLSAFCATLIAPYPFPTSARYILAAIFAVGLTASLTAEWPWWAIKEWARYIGLSLLVLTAAMMSRKHRAQWLLLGLMALVGFLHAFQFVIYYLSAFISGLYLLQADLLFNGFSNPRFFGQFQVMLIPILALLIGELRQRGWRRLAALLLAALAVQWCIALTLGGRGVWLALAASHIALFCISRKFGRLFATQLAAALLGVVLFIVLFHLIPGWLDLSPTLRDNLRTTSSGRVLLWQWAWDMATANPWLGVGPMHYAATFNPIAAHPHQVILQWAAEWGFPATILAIGLAAWGIIHGALYLRRDNADHWDAALWLSIVGALVLAQVDGVFVMPYTETWLAILIGLALARWSTPAPQTRVQRYGTMLLAVPVIVICSHVLLVEVPRLAEDSQTHREAHSSGYTPRFWQQGWIPNGGVGAE